MAETGMGDILKRFAAKITTSSVKERLEILQNLHPCLQQPDLPENTIKGILRILLFTLSRYQDGKSRHAVERVIAILAAQHFHKFSKLFNIALDDLAEQQKTLPPCSFNSAVALNALGWSMVLVLHGYAQVQNADAWQDEEFCKLVQLQGLLLYGAFATERTTINQAAYNRLKRIWKTVPGSLEKYVAAVGKKDPSMYIMCLVSCMMRYLAASKDRETITRCKAGFLELYIKQVIGSRSKPAAHLLRSCHQLLRHVSHEDFRETILPAVEKAMLRNPEIMIGCVCDMIAGVTIDLSVYALDVGKYLATQCHSKDEEFRQIAAGGCKHLAKQCSDPAAVERLVKHFFAVLNGSEGKLTGTAQRLGLLSGIGNVSHNSVSGVQLVQSLSSEVAELFITVLQQEVHEGSLVHALSMFSPWCAKFTTDVPTKLCQWFKTGLGLKSSSSAVRNAYIQCMSATFSGDTLIHGLELLPLLLQTVEKAYAQPAQIPLVTEGLSASCLLLQLSLADIQAEAKLDNFWKLLLDMDKQVFVNDKFLTSASEEALQSVAVMVERLILGHPQRMDEKNSRAFYKAVLFALVQRSYPVRRQAQQSVKRMVAALSGGQVAVALVKEFRPILETQQLQDPDLLRDEEAAAAEQTSIPPKILSEAVLCLALVPSAQAGEADLLATETLIDAHHPCIVAHNEDTWTDLLVGLKRDAADFVTSHQQNILADLKNSHQISQAQCNAVSTLVRIDPEVLLPQVMDHVATLLRNPTLLTVTRHEMAIMLTPDGELHDKSVIQGGVQQTDDTSNMKRENKLYSYADQMAELELKKELQKKSKTAHAEPKLSKKQQEVMDAQLKKEAAIRNRLHEFDRQVENACLLLSACSHGNPMETRKLMVKLLRVMLLLLRSPLAAPRITRSFIQLGEAAFEDEDKHFAHLVAYATLRLQQPECALDGEWCDEPLRHQAVRALNTMHAKTVPPRSGSEKPTVSPRPFAAPTFAYCFYLLRSLLERGGEKVGGDEMTMLKALVVISTHTRVRERPTKKGQVDEMGPELLPREEILKLCTQIIGTSSGRVQQMAAQTLLETAKCGSGLPGCAAACQPEITALLQALLSPVIAVREAGLQGLSELQEVIPTPDVDYENGLLLTKRIWTSRFDPEEEISKLAEKLWNEAELPLDPELCPMLVDDLVHHEEVVRQAAADALAAALDQHRSQVELMLQMLLEKYQDKLYIPAPILDQFGRVVSEPPPDDWQARSGVAMAIRKLSPYIPNDQIKMVFGFFVEKAMGDRSEEVRKHMLNAAVTAINDHGKKNVNLLLPVFEDFLAKAPATAKYDSVRQSVVILMGSLAKHLDKDDPKVKPIVGKLIETLSTPSQQVQEAVANCLPPLVPAIKAGAPDLVKQLMQLLLESENYGERKGAAYGLAGLVKGLGILALKQLDIMATLTEAIQNKKTPRYREGALFALEMLCVMLGRLFEPYVVHILPHLLLCFGDPNQYVREAADDTAKAVMSKLSAHGVKLILPSLLSALEEDSWRTKTGSVELLGAMAYCAPKQLSQCLPSIVPKLTEVLTDSHLKVQKAGAQALKQIGSVIKNPEIQEIVPILLEALQDPTSKTTTSLHRLLETKFVHFIDAPSLALIMPVVQRAFQDRSTETRKMAAQIIGNMYSLTDQKDLSPYLPTVIPGLKASLLDPVPDVRSVSSRALGAMVRGMGETGFEELVPWLMETLTSEASSVDRSGAAQGLSEVVGGLGLEKLHKLMPDIIQTAERVDIAPHVRDGYIMMYIYLPPVFGDDFLPYVAPIIPSILKALADESEFVRDTALRAGQRIVNLYADTAIELLLPELEKGLFDDNWRIRYSSVQLLGDLLYKISGVSGKMSTEGAGEDDNFGTESSQQAVFQLLGPERRNRVLAGLYMGRSDTALMVRQSALHVWKVIVTHTPKTLREILSTLFELLLGCLASQSYDKRQVAARTLGDIVRKLGEKVLPEIIPILERGLESAESDQRQGVCIGLTEIMASTSKDHILIFADSLIPTVRKALCDPLPEVREAAARTFDNLHSNIGSRALDDILPNLLRQLDDAEMSEFALDGLKQVMAIKSRVVLPFLVPQLTAAPVNTRALSFLSAVAGEALTRHLVKILPALLKALSNSMGTAQEQQELEYCRSVVLSVVDEAGVRIVMEELLSATNCSEAALRCAAVTILHAYCAQTKVDLSEYVPQLLRGLIRLFTDSDERVLNASWDCLNAVTKALDASEMLTHIQNVKTAIRFAVSDFKGTELPGFCLPKKGITPILPIFREGILNGPPELKESAALGLGEAIKLTSADALKPSVVNITGPLIRILGDRFSFNVKVAVLETLGLLLGKCGVMLRPFIPQLQTTFVKALNDPNRNVRLKAASALSKLVAVHPRADPLFTELHTAIKMTDDSTIRDTMLQALRGCISNAGAKMSEKIRKEVVDTLQEYIRSEDHPTRTTAAACLGCLCTWLSDDDMVMVLGMCLLDADSSLDWYVRHGRAVGLSIALKEAAARLTTEEYKARTVKAVLAYTAADRVPICLSGLRGIGFLLFAELKDTSPVTMEAVTVLAKSMKQDSNEVKQFAAKILGFLAKSVERALDVDMLKVVVPMLVNGTKEKNTVVRSHSESALVAVLRLRHTDAVLQTCLSALEPGMSTVLTEVVNKVLKKIIQTPDIGDDNIDDTSLV